MRETSFFATVCLFAMACSSPSSGGGDPAVDAHGVCSADVVEADGCGPSLGADGADGDAATAAPGLDAVVDAASSDGSASDAGEQDGADVGVDVAAVPTATVGGARPVAVTAPPDWTPAKKWPLILVLHGYSANGAVQSAYLGITDRAAALGYVTLAPDGTLNSGGKLFWNATAACCDFEKTGVDDVAYLSGLIDESIAKLAVDPQRVYVVGHSNGGFMAYRLACEVSSRIAAIAVIAGATHIDPGVCKAPQPVSVLHIHGTADGTIAYAGGSTGGAAYPGASASVGQWLDRDACGKEAAVDASADYDTTVKGAETERTFWSGCSGGTHVALWRMVGSPHIPVFSDTFRDDVAAWLLAQNQP